MMRHFTKVIFLLLLSVMTISAAAQPPAHLFFDQLTSLCGSRYVGEMTFPIEGRDSFKGKLLVAEIKQCEQAEIRVPFAVGDNTSRTWIFTKTQAGLRLKHDHRHADGTVDKVSNYGGDASNSGSALRQSFPADEYTGSLIPAASTNVWTISLSADYQQLTYHLERAGKPRFTAVLKRLAE